MSTSAPDAESLAFMMNTAEQALDVMQAQAAANPSDIVLQRTVIETATRLGRLAEAKKHLTSLRLAFPEDFDTLADHIFLPVV